MSKVDSLSHLPEVDDDQPWSDWREVAPTIARAFIKTMESSYPGFGFRDDMAAIAEFTFHALRMMHCLPPAGIETVEEYLRKWA
jgi:hypothetical protein